MQGLKIDIGGIDFNDNATGQTARFLAEDYAEAPAVIAGHHSKRESSGSKDARRESISRPRRQIGRPNIRNGRARFDLPAKRHLKPAHGFSNTQASL